MRSRRSTLMPLSRVFSISIRAVKFASGTATGPCVGRSHTIRPARTAATCCGASRLGALAPWFLAFARAHEGSNASDRGVLRTTRSAVSSSRRRCGRMRLRRTASAAARSAASHIRQRGSPTVACVRQRWPQMSHTTRRRRRRGLMRTGLATLAGVLRLLALIGNEFVLGGFVNLRVVSQKEG